MDVDMKDANIGLVKKILMFVLVVLLVLGYCLSTMIEWTNVKKSSNEKKNYCETDRSTGTPATTAGTHLYSSSAYHSWDSAPSTPHEDHNNEHNYQHLSPKDDVEMEPTLYVNAINSNNLYLLDEPVSKQASAAGPKTAAAGGTIQLDSEVCFLFSSFIRSVKGLVIGVLRLVCWLLVVCNAKQGGRYSDPRLIAEEESQQMDIDNGYIPNVIPEDEILGNLITLVERTREQTIEQQHND